jgi:hypothetical protein
MLPNYESFILYFFISFILDLILDSDFNILHHVIQNLVNLSLFPSFHLKIRDLIISFTNNYFINGQLTDRGHRKSFDHFSQGYSPKIISPKIISPNFIIFTLLNQLHKL